MQSFKYILDYQNFLFEGEMKKPEWLKHDFKYTIKMVEILSNLSNKVILEEGRIINVKDIKNLDEVLDFLNDIINGDLTRENDEFKEWFTKHPAKGLMVDNEVIPISNISKTKNQVTGIKRGADVTRMQELASARSFEISIEEQRVPGMEDLIEIYPDVDKKWMNNFIQQTKALKKWLGPENGYDYYREGGMMDLIEKTAKMLKISKKDTWTPADVWIVKKDMFKEISEVFKNLLENPEDDNDIKREKINFYLRDKFNKKEAVGISLKEVKKEAYVEEVNTTGEAYDFKRFSVNIWNIENKLYYNSSVGFTKKEISFMANLEEHDILAKIRSRAGESPRGTLATEMKYVGAIAKLGDVPAEIIDEYFQRIGDKRLTGTDLPKVGKWTSDDFDFWTDMFNDLLNSNFNKEFKIDFGDIKTTKQFADLIKIAAVDETNSNEKASRFSTKLQGLAHLSSYSKLYDNGLLDEFLISILLGSQKKRNDGAPFLKIY